MPTIQVAGPRALPASRDYIKRYSRISQSDEDLLVDSWLRSATLDIQASTWRQLVTSTCEHVRDCFPFSGVWRLPRAPLRKVESIRYLDDAGAEQTLATSVYRVVQRGETEPGLIELAYGQSWPTTYPVMGAVRARFVAGYATPFSADPASDVLSAAGHSSVDGDLVQLSTSDGDLPSPLERERDYYARDVVVGVSLKLAATAGGAAIDIEDGGTGLNFLGVIPDPLLQAIALLVRHFDANREPVITGSIVAEMPMSIRSLIAPYVLA